MLFVFMLHDGSKITNQKLRLARSRVIDRKLVFGRKTCRQETPSAGSDARNNDQRVRWRRIDHDELERETNKESWRIDGRGRPQDFLNFHSIFSHFLEAPAKLFLRQQVFRPRERASYRDSGQPQPGRAIGLFLCFSLLLLSVGFIPYPLAPRLSC